MKIVFTLFCIFCIQQLHSQANEELQKAWKEVKTHLQHKTKDAGTIAILAQDSKTADRNVLSKVQVYLKRVSVSCQENTELNTVNFSNLNQSNDSLDTYMAVLMKQIESEKAFLFSKAYAVFKDQFTLQQKRLMLAAYDFNRVAESTGNKFLFTRKEVAPEVNFD